MEEKRLLALLQISENHRAEREFRKIISNFSIKEYPLIISFAAKNKMPGLAFRLSAILRNDHGLIYLGGLYPLPNWNIDKAYLKIKHSYILYQDKNLVLTQELKVLQTLLD